MYLSKTKLTSTKCTATMKQLNLPKCRQRAQLSGKCPKRWASLPLLPPISNRSQNASSSEKYQKWDAILPRPLFNCQHARRTRGLRGKSQKRETTLPLRPPPFPNTFRTRGRQENRPNEKPICEVYRLEPKYRENAPLLVKSPRLRSFCLSYHPYKTATEPAAFRGIFRMG